MWDNGKMRVLPTLGGPDGYATSANDSGQAVGWAETTTKDSTCTGGQVFGFRAVIWNTRTRRIETALPPLHNDTATAATAINDRGVVAGISGTCGNAVGGTSAAHAVLWDHGRMVNMQTLGTGTEWNTPAAINASGETAGFVNRPGPSQGNLNPDYPGQFVAANAINDRGVITGQAIDAGHTVAFEAVPAGPSKLPR